MVYLQCSLCCCSWLLCFKISIYLKHDTVEKFSGIIYKKYQCDTNYYIFFSYDFEKIKYNGKKIMLSCYPTMSFTLGFSSIWFSTWYTRTIKTGVNYKKSQLFLSCFNFSSFLFKSLFKVSSKILQK